MLQLFSLFPLLKLLFIKYLLFITTTQSFIMSNVHLSHFPMRIFHFCFYINSACDASIERNCLIVKVPPLPVASHVLLYFTHRVVRCWYSTSSHHSAGIKIDNHPNQGYSVDQWGGIELPRASNSFLSKRMVCTRFRKIIIYLPSFCLSCHTWHLRKCFSIINGDLS